MLTAHALLRIAGGTSGILIGLYLAGLSNGGASIGAGLAGSLGAVSFAAELFASIPMGIAADRLQPRWLMSGGAVLGGVAVQLFALTGSSGIFFISRALEGIGAAAIVPALLAYIADKTEGSPTLRVRVMSYFELTLLAGLASHNARRRGNFSPESMPQVRTGSDCFCSRMRSYSASVLRSGASCCHACGFGLPCVSRSVQFCPLAL